MVRFSVPHALLIKVMSERVQTLAGFAVSLCIACRVIKLLFLYTCLDKDHEIPRKEGSIMRALII